jgi:hypothetical protein
MQKKSATFGFLELGIVHPKLYRFSNYLFTFGLREPALNIYSLILSLLFLPTFLPDKITICSVNILLVNRRTAFQFL